APLVHHSDRGVQYLSIRYTERLAEAGIERSVGSAGDSYDNALAESVVGLFKTEVIRRRGPWRGVEDVEFATLDARLLTPLRYVRRRSSSRLTMTVRLPQTVWRFSTDQASGNPGAVQNGLHGVIGVRP